MAVEKTLEIGADRHISLDFTAPETLPCGETQVVVLLIPGTAASGAGKSGFGMVAPEQLGKLLTNGAQVFGETYSALLDLQEAQMMISRNSGKSHKDKSFAKHAGCLKKSSLFRGDSVAIQKEMRSEWD